MFASFATESEWQNLLQQNAKTQGEDVLFTILKFHAITRTRPKAYAPDILHTLDSVPR
jgi:hypothetical protein